MAIDDLFRLVLGSEVSLVLRILDPPLQLLTTELGSLILQGTGRSGLSPAKHLGCWLTFKPGSNTSALRRLFRLARSTHSRVVLGDG